MQRLLLLGLLFALIIRMEAHVEQVEYHMGVGGNSELPVIFTFSRGINTTTVTWQQFGAEANGSGIITTTPADTYPIGFKMSNLYRGFLPMSLTRWSFVYVNRIATVQVSSIHPVITVLPVDNSTFTPGQFVTVRSGSITYLNADVNLNGQPMTISGLLATLGAEAVTTIGASATAVLATAASGTTASNQHSTTALAIGISVPVTFVALMVIAITF